MPVKLNDLIEILGKKIGLTIRIEELPDQLGDVAITYADIAKGKELLGWQPKVSLEQGIEKFLTWHKEYGKV